MGSDGVLPEWTRELRIDSGEWDGAPFQNQEKTLRVHSFFSIFREVDLRDPLNCCHVLCTTALSVYSAGPATCVAHAHDPGTAAAAHRLGRASLAHWQPMTFGRTLKKALVRCGQSPNIGV